MLLDLFYKEVVQIRSLPLKRRNQAQRSIPERSRVYPLCFLLLSKQEMHSALLFVPSPSQREVGRDQARRPGKNPQAFQQYGKWMARRRNFQQAQDWNSRKICFPSWRCVWPKGQKYVNHHRGIVAHFHINWRVNWWHGNMNHCGSIQYYQPVLVKFGPSYS